jgi:hypothetical protein
MSVIVESGCFVYVHVCVFWGEVMVGFPSSLSPLPPDQCQDSTSNKSLPVYRHIITIFAFAVMVFSYTVYNRTQPYKIGIILKEAMWSEFM